MTIYKFQVVVMDTRDYIIKYKDFSIAESQEMAGYIMKNAMDLGATIKITRWDEFCNRI